MAEPKKDHTAIFGLMFTVPKICLVLRTKKKVLSKKLGGDPQQQEWELHTYLDQISVQMLQHKNTLSLMA